MAYHELSEKDVQQSGVQNGYQLLRQPTQGAKRIKAGVFPGGFGFPDLHISHYDHTAVVESPRSGKQIRLNIFLTVYTNQALTKADEERINQGALEYLIKEGLVRK
jgi:hypothetical protein